MGWSWRARVGRAGLAIGLALAALGAAFLVALLAMPGDAADVAWQRRFAVANAALLAGFGVALLRRRPGLGYLALAAASTAVSAVIEDAWRSSLSVAQFSDAPVPGYPAHGLIALAVLLRGAVPAAILGLYAATPERRLGRWVGPVVAVLAVALTGAAALRFLYEQAAPIDGTWPASELLYQLDQPIPVWFVGLLGLLGGLRVEAQRHIPRRDRLPGPAGPTRSIVIAAAAVAVLLVPAALVFATRPIDVEYQDEGALRLVVLPLLLALVGVVVARWSPLLGWAALAGAFQAVVVLVLNRAVAEYVAVALAQPPDSSVPMPLAFLAFMAAATIMLGFAFAAGALSLRAALVPGPIPPRVERAWAIGGALVGLLGVGWFLLGTLVGSASWLVIGYLSLPLCPIAIALALGAWRRLVPAVAGAESVALTPFRPFLYLETVVVEAISGRAGQVRELQETLRRIATERYPPLLEPAMAGAGGLPAARPRALDRSELRRPSDREIDVLRLVVTGAGNEAIAHELVLSLKTVESHLRRLFDRYGVTNRTELAVLAVREGWIDAAR